MLKDVCLFLNTIKNGLIKPDARITVELSNMGTDIGLKFQFLWYEDKVIKLNVFITSSMFGAVFDESVISEYIIRFVNRELDKSASNVDPDRLITNIRIAMNKIEDLTALVNEAADQVKNSSAIIEDALNELKEMEKQNGNVR